MLSQEDVIIGDSVQALGHRDPSIPSLCLAPDTLTTLALPYPYPTPLSDPEKLSALLREGFNPA